MESEREGRRSGAGRHAAGGGGQQEPGVSAASPGQRRSGLPVEGELEAHSRRREEHATTVQRPGVGADADLGSEPGWEELLGQGAQASVHLLQGDGQRWVRRSALDPESSWGEVPEAWDHPHLVWIKDVERRRRGLLLEHLPGGSAAGLVAARGRLPLGEAVTLLVPVARALGHLHSCGATHGDVHPGNVLFRADGAPVLVDPGLARALGEAPSGGGAPGFSAPEQEHDAAADVFGWGALAWFVMTGEAPGEGGYRVPLSLQCEGVAAGTAQLIEDCLDPDPMMRPAAADLAPELLAAQDAAPLDATAAAQAEGAAHLITRGAGSRRSPHRSSAGVFGRLTPRGWVIRRGRRREAALALREGLRRRGGRSPVGSGGSRGGSERRRGALRGWLGAPERVTDFVRRDTRAARRKTLGWRAGGWKLLAGLVAVVAGLGTAWVAADRPGWPEAAPTAGTETVGAPVGAPVAGFSSPAQDSASTEARSAAPAPVSSPPTAASSAQSTAPSSAPPTAASGAPSSTPVSPRSGLPKPPPATGAASPRAAQATAALSALDRLRTHAIKDADRAALQRVYSTAGARAADEALLKDLAKRGVRYASLESRVERPTVVASSSSPRPTVIVRAVVTSIAEEEGGGAPGAKARAQSTLRFTLVLTDLGWRIERIAPA